MTANRNVLGSLGAVLAIVLANVATAAGLAPAVRSTLTSTPGGGPQEGVKVHGDWTLEVRNPDGTLAARRGFRNAHISSHGILPQLLGRQISTGTWAIALWDSTPANPQPCSTATANLSCGLFEGPLGVGASGVAAASTTLNVSVVGLGSVPTLRLTGSFTATTAANINIAFTLFTNCPATTAPATPCWLQSPGSQTHEFSQTGSGAFPAVGVVPGQIVQVTVAFSFS